jgi:hypothetical protein
MPVPSRMPSTPSGPFRFAVYRVEWRGLFFKRVLVTHAWGIYV